MLRLAELWIHPVKSLAGRRVPEAVVEDRGLRHDRRFMVVDPDGRFLTQRTLPAMATLTAAVEGDLLILDGPAGAPLPLPLEGGEVARAVTVWGDRVEALDMGDDAAAWLRDRLGVDARLVRMPQGTRRSSERARHAGDVVSFADAFPFLLLTEASIEALNARLDVPVDARRFRPNLVVAGATPFAEDGWTTLSIGSVTFHVSKPCARCQIVNVDPDRGVATKEPLATLASFRKEGSNVMFGQNLVHDGEGTIRVGDRVDARG